MMPGSFLSDSDLLNSVLGLIDSDFEEQCCEVFFLCINCYL